MTPEAAMRRIAGAADSRWEADDRQQQHEMYGKSFRALAAVDPDDDNEGVAVLTAWILERIEETGERPRSRAVRDRALDYCRNNGYAVPDDSWLHA